MSEEGEAIRRISDRMMTEALYGTSTTPQPLQEPLTYEKLLKLMVGMPPKETWLSTKLFPGTSFTMFEGANERFTVAHPDLWLRLEDHLRKTAEPVTGPPPLFDFNTTPTEIDFDAEDNPERALWKQGIWARLKEALEVAMTPLPEWLRNAPKFTTHG